MPSKDELVAHDRTNEQIAAHIGADLVIFQTLPDLIDSCRQLNPEIQQFDCSVFTGEYVTGGVNQAYLSHVEKLRNDKAKVKKDSTFQPEMEQEEEESNGCSGPMSKYFSVYRKRAGPNDLSLLTLDGSDALIGLPNHSPKITPKDIGGPNDEVGLHNSRFGVN